MKIGSLENPCQITETYTIAYDSGELGTAQTSITISGLDGDVDEEYCLIGRFIDGGNGSDYFLRPNNDTGINYGYQRITGTSTTVAALRSTGITYLLIGTAGLSNEICLTKTILYAKSGYLRTAISDFAWGISGTTTSSIWQLGHSWNNTTDNITSLTLQSATNGLGVGSRIILLKKVTSTSGLKTGSLEVQGKVYGVWQKVYEYTIPNYGAYDKLLIHGNAIADATGKTVTAFGNAAVTTAQYKFPEVGASIVFDGDGDYLSLSNSSDFDFGAGDFTIDFWIYINGSQAADVGIINFGNTQGDPVDTNWIIYCQGTTFVRFLASTSGTDWDVIVDFTGISTGTWLHLAVVRTGNVYKTFTNGVLGNTVTVSGAIQDINSPLEIGRWVRTGATRYFNGWIDELRISKGIARWTANFTPPVYSDYGGATTSLTISGLDGNTDVMYRLSCRFVSGTAGTIGFKFNNDSGTNYGRQKIYGENTTAATFRITNDTYVTIGYASTNYLSIANILIYAKSGYLRTTIVENSEDITGTTVFDIGLTGSVWNNTADNVTSLVITGVTNGLGVGSYLLLEKLVLS